MSPEEDDTTAEDEASYAPESGQPAGGRDNPWDQEDAADAASKRAFPADHREPPGNDL